MSDPLAKSARLLRILHLEDDSRDAELVREVLATEGVACDITVASNRESFFAALDKGNIDLIMSDYKLPDIHGDEALSLVRERWPDLPFIFVSGSIGEERASEVVKRGATDYVMKERLRRLGIAIHRAIEEAEGHQRRRDAEARLEAEREFLSDIFASVQDGIVILNDRMEIVRTNPTVERLFAHLMPLAGKSWDDVFCTNNTRMDDNSAPRTTFRTGQSAQEHLRCHTVHGETEFTLFSFPLIERRTGNQTGVILYLRDVTREQILQKQLIQAQKMECIGQLAGSVAHDFNNILQVILSASELLGLSISDKDPRRLEVEEIRKTADRAIALTRQLLTFSRKQPISLTAANLNHLVENMKRMMDRLLPGNINSNFDLDPALASIKCDPSQIEQVILNLIVNARDAMPHGGTLQVSTRNQIITLAEAEANSPKRSAGRYVCLSVQDSGIGISPDNMPRLFEPFFTTKEQGKGTGLGLPTVYGIVTQHGGWIDVTSQPDIGSTFAVFLPAPDDYPAAT